MKQAADTQLLDIWGGVITSYCSSTVSWIKEITGFFSIPGTFSRCPGQLADIISRICFNRTVNKIYGFCNLEHSDHRILFKTYMPFSFLEISPLGNIWSSFSFWDTETSVINVEKLKSILVISPRFVFQHHVLLPACSVQTHILLHRAELEPIAHFQQMCCAGPGLDLPGVIFPGYGST